MTNQEIMDLLDGLEDLHDLTEEQARQCLFFEVRPAKDYLNDEDCAEVIWIPRPLADDADARVKDGPWQWAKGYGYRLGWVPRAPLDRIEGADPDGPCGLYVGDPAEVRQTLLDAGWEERHGLFELRAHDSVAPCRHRWVCEHCGERHDD